MKKTKKNLKKEKKKLKKEGKPLKERKICLNDYIHSRKVGGRDKGKEPNTKPNGENRWAKQLSLSRALRK